MKMRATRNSVLTRVVLVCLLACAIFSQGVFNASAHQGSATRILNVSVSKAIGLSAVLPGCEKSTSGDTNAPTQHNSKMECCAACLSSDAEDTLTALVNYAKIIALLTPSSDEGSVVAWTDPATCLDQRGLKSSWSAQAPPAIG